MSPWWFGVSPGPRVERSVYWTVTPYTRQCRPEVARKSTANIAKARALLGATACRRPATAAGDHSGRAACGALPMPALRRPHDRHRGLRARLRAEVAADAKRVRHVMSRTSSARRLPLPLRWLRAGGHPSQPHSGQSMRPAPSTPSKLRSGRFFPSLANRRVQLFGPRRPGVAPASNARQPEIPIALAAQPPPG